MTGETLLACLALFCMIGAPALAACYVSFAGPVQTPVDAEHARPLYVFTADELEALETMERDLADMQRAQDADVLRKANREVTRRRSLSAPRALPDIAPSSRYRWPQP